VLLLQNYFVRKMLFLVDHFCYFLCKFFISCRQKLMSLTVIAITANINLY